LLGLFLAGIAVELTHLHGTRQRALRAGAAWAAKCQERDRLIRESPALSREYELVLGEAMATASQAWSQVLIGWPVAAELPAAMPPPTPVEGFLELAAYDERIRREAQQAGVAIGAEVTLGFGNHAKEGPLSSELSVVHRQFQELDWLVSALLAARPQALLAVQRENPAGGKNTNTTGRPGDFFTLPNFLSLRQEGLIATDAFRLVFTGETEVLRHYLQALAGSNRPRIVRSVEVEPVSVARHVGRLAQNPAASDPGPRSCQFTVAVEVPRWTANALSP